MSDPVSSDHAASEPSSAFKPSEAGRVTQAFDDGIAVGQREGWAPRDAEIRSAALEEAAKVCDEWPFVGWDSTHEYYEEPNPAAAAIRALKDKP